MKITNPFHMSHPLVSAVIPAYNAEAYIEETIQSLLHQTKSLNEIIIVDDFSTDRTYDIVEHLVNISSGRVKLYRQSQNQGVSASRNLGVQKAKNDWILFMDADDIAEPNLVELEYQRLLKLQNQWDQTIILTYSAYSQISAAGESIAGIHRSQQVLPEEILGYELVRNQIVATSGVLVKRTVFLEAGGFNISLKYSEDWDLWLRLAQLGGFAYADTPLVRVRRHSGNASKNVQNMLDGERTVLGRYDISFIEQAINRRHLPPEVNLTDLASILYRLGKWEEGFKIVQDVVGNYPDFADGYFMKGLFYLNRKQWHSAQTAFNKTLTRSPEHGAAINNLATVVALLGSKKEAQKLFSSVLSLYPNYLDARHNLNTLNAAGHLDPSEIRFTWRKLRPVLTPYTEKSV